MVSHRIASQLWFAVDRVWSRVRHPLGRELKTLVEGGKRYRQAQVGNLDRCCVALKKDGALDAKPSGLVANIDHGPLLVLAYKDIGANGLRRVVVAQFQALIDPPRAFGQHFEYRH